MHLVCLETSITFKLLHELKAVSSMLIIGETMQTVLILVHSLKTSLPTLKTFDGINILLGKATQPSNKPCSIYFNFLGILTCFNLIQCWNAYSPIDNRLLGKFIEIK